MDDIAKEFLDSYVRIPLRAKVKDSDTFAEAKRKIAIYRDLRATDMASIKLAAGSDLQEESDKRNRRLFVPVDPPPPSPHTVAKREEKAKEMRRRARLPDTDLSGPPEEVARTLRLIAAQEEREARSGITDDDDDDDEAGDVRRPEDVRGTAARPIDLTREPAKSKTKRARVAPRKARKARR